LVEIYITIVCCCIFFSPIRRVFGFGESFDFLSLGFHAFYICIIINGLWAEIDEFDMILRMEHDVMVG